MSFFDRLIRTIETKIRRNTIGKVEAKVRNTQLKAEQKMMRGVNKGLDPNSYKKKKKDTDAPDADAPDVLPE